MPPARASSSSSTEHVAGFRLEREIGAGSRGTVYEATQVNLARRVALKILPSDPGLAARFRRLEWPEHPHVVSLYAAGTSEHGHFVAMQLVHGPTLAELQEAGKLRRAQAVKVLAGVAAALDAAHAEGMTHGAVGAQNIFVGENGHALLSDFGLGTEPGSPESDRAAFAALVQQLLGKHAPPAGGAAASASAILPPPAERSRRRRRQLVALGVAGLAAIAVAAVVLWPSEQQPERAPPILAGAQVLGSGLPTSGTASLDCEGRPASSSSQQCTVMQARLPGRALSARADGAIRRWVVSGASGELALRLLRPRGGVLEPVARTPYEPVPDGGAHAFAADLPVRRGDRVAIELAPAATIGVRRNAPGATTQRWLGSLSALGARPADRGEGTGFDHEVLLRVEYVPGARPRQAGRLTGRAAAVATPGRKLRELTTETPGRQVRTVVLIRVEGRIAVDLFDGQRRLARLPLFDADPTGRPLGLVTNSPSIARLTWRNPGGETVSHDYAVRARSLKPRS
jgi:Protein kinase domain